MDTNKSQFLEWANSCIENASNIEEYGAIAGKLPCEKETKTVDTCNDYVRQCYGCGGLNHEMKLWSKPGIQPFYRQTCINCGGLVWISFPIK